MANHPRRLRVAIIGAGFSGTSLAATLINTAPQSSVEIFMFDRSGHFGTGIAYSTPHPFHLLNVRVKDMSAFRDKPDHFLHWLSHAPEAQAYIKKDLPLSHQYAPRFLYGRYLQAILNELEHTHFIAQEVVDLTASTESVTVLLADGTSTTVDVAVLCTGNDLPLAPPFPIKATDRKRCILNPWEFLKLQQIAREDTVLITGTGLSMIDAVLTLHHHQHSGKIYALSRHGLLPLPHSDADSPLVIDPSQLPKELSSLSKFLRQKARHLKKEQGDWRALINGIRMHIQHIWQNLNIRDRKAFLRHLLPYWNIHRHRVPNHIAQFLNDLAAKGQLHVLAGRIMGIADHTASIQLRHHKAPTQLSIDWLINCIGPSLNMKKSNSRLLDALMQKGLMRADELNLGIAIDQHFRLLNNRGEYSPRVFAIGPPTKGMAWETVAVPDICKQSYECAQSILAIGQ